MRYGSFKYGEEKYGVVTPENILWGLLIDWDDDGIFNESNEASRLKHVSIQRGRNNLIAAGSDGFEPIQPGRMTLILDNGDRRYDSYYEDSPLYPNVDIDRLVWLLVRIGDTKYDVFTGTIQDIIPSNDTVEINVEDGHRWLMDQNINTAVLEATGADAAIGTILNQALWPWGRELDTGADVLDYWWARGRNANEEIRAIADSEFGRAFVNASGDFIFISRFGSSTPVLIIDQSQVLKNVALPQLAEVRKNIIQVQSHPIIELVQTAIWSSAEIMVGGNQTVELTVDFDDPAVDVLQPVANTDYTAFSLPGGAGSNLTANIAITATIYGESAALSIVNSGGTDAYLNLLQLRGKPLSRSTYTYRTTGTGYDRRPRELSIDLEWQQDVNNPAAFADDMLNYFGGIRKLPVIQIESRPELQFATDLFDAITLQLPALNVSDSFQVGSINHEWLSGNGQAILTTWKLEPYKGYAYWRFPGQLDVTQLG